MSVLEISSENAQSLMPPLDHRKFSFTLGKQLINVVGIQLMDAIIPFSWNIVHDLNKTFQLTRGGAVETITLPEGTFSAYDLAVEMNTLMNTGNNPVACTYEPGPDQFKFSSNLRSTRPRPL